jgi:hypothetical protein
MKRSIILVIILATFVLGLCWASGTNAFPANRTRSSIAAVPHRQLATTAGISYGSQLPNADAMNVLGISLTTEEAKLLRFLAIYFGLIILIPLLYQWLRCRSLTKARQALAHHSDTVAAKSGSGGWLAEFEQTFSIPTRKVCAPK